MLTIFHLLLTAGFAYAAYLGVRKIADGEILAGAFMLAFFGWLTVYNLRLMGQERGEGRTGSGKSARDVDYPGSTEDWTGGD